MIDDICRLFDAPVDRRAALGAARRAAQDEAFAVELQRVAAWIHAIETAIAPAERESER